MIISCAAVRLITLLFRCGNCKAQVTTQELLRIKGLTHTQAVCQEEPLSPLALRCWLTRSERKLGPQEIHQSG
jgi:hypothetical protein